MKKLLFLCSFTLVLFASVLVSVRGVAADVTGATAKVGAAKDASTTAHNFEDLLIQGKYHFSDEAVTTVEADKVFDSLIGVRSDFKDRLEDSATKQ